MRTSKLKVCAARINEGSCFSCSVSGETVNEDICNKCVGSTVQMY